MTCWPRIRRKIAEAHRSRERREPRAFRLACEWLGEYLQDNPEAEEQDVKMAAGKAGLDPVTVAVISLIVSLALELWRAWRNRT